MRAQPSSGPWRRAGNTGPVRLTVVASLLFALPLTMLAAETALPRGTLIQSGLFAVFFVSLPLLTFVLNWRYPLHPRDAMRKLLLQQHAARDEFAEAPSGHYLWLARWGHTRRRFSLYRLAQHTGLLALASYALAALVLRLAYSQAAYSQSAAAPGAVTLERELWVMLPVSLALAWLMSSFHAALRSWLGPVGLLFALLYVAGIALKSRAGSPNGSVWTPHYHMRHILGLLHTPTDMPGWLSLAVVLSLAGLLSVLALRRTPS